MNESTHHNVHPIQTLREHTIPTASSLELSFSGSEATAGATSVPSSSSNAPQREPLHSASSEVAAASATVRNHGSSRGDSFRPPAAEDEGTSSAFLLSSASGSHHVPCSLSSHPVVEKFDSACSRCVSGSPGRLVEVFPATDPSYRQKVHGFNGTTSSVTRAGRNRDGMTEYYIADMPPSLCLLCANEYAKKGAAILYADDGVVLSLKPDQLRRLRQFVDSMPPLKRLQVANGTYEVVPDPTEDVATNPLSLSCEEVVQEALNPQETVTAEDTDTLLTYADSPTPTAEGDVDAVVYSSTSTKYFNSRVQVSNVDERILAYLIAGFTIPMLKSYLEKGLIHGLHPSVTMHSINAFARRYGNTPDPFALAHPFPYGGERGGYLTRPLPITAIGQWVQADFFEPDYSGRDIVMSPPTTESSEDRLRRKKIVAFGGAKFGFVSIDKFSGYVHCLLTPTTGDQMIVVQDLVSHYRTYNHNIKLLGADSGIIPSKMFRVLTTEVQQYLSNCGIRIRLSEPHNHQNGTPDVERAIRDIKESISKAIGYILSNPNFPHLGFTRQQIFMLWGELTHWAIMVHNLHQCSNKPDCTRYEAFTGDKPDVLTLRMLPIFAVVHVQRVPLTADNTLDDTNRKFWQRGIYVGPDLHVRGAIRVAVLTPKKRVTIIRSTKFKQVSDGGDLNIHAHVQRGLDLLLSPPTTDAAEESDDDSTVVVEPPPRKPTTPPSTHTQPPTAPTTPTQTDPSTPSNTPNDNPPHHHLPTADVSTSPTRRRRAQRRRKQKTASPAGTSPHDTNNVHPGEDPRHHPEPPVPQPSPSAPAPSRRTHRPYIAQINDILTRMRRPNRRYVPDDALTAIVSPTPAPLDDDDDDTIISDEPFTPVQQISSAPCDEDCAFTVSFTDWTTHEDADFYFTPTGGLVQISTEGDVEEAESQQEQQCYRAVTQNVPKSFQAALRDPLWGDAARKEWQTILEAGTLMKVDKPTAKSLRQEGADLVVLFPVFEHKIKDGKDVYKVRLVANGKGHHPTDSVFSATPRREELLVLLHLAAAHNWAICHLDEVRAYLSASYKGSRPVLTRLVHDTELYRVVGALYGLKSSPRDYQTEVAQRLTELGFTRLPLSSCIYTKRVEDHVLVVYDYVDDFILTGSVFPAVIQDHFVAPFRGLANTTEPVWDPTLLLGMEVRRDPARRVICLTMRKRIADLAKLVSSHTTLKERHIPIPPSRYILTDEDLAALPPSLSEPLSIAQQKLYMGIVGSLIWISGVRHDILFATSYLSWFTQAPRVHHLHMAYHVVAFLDTTIEIPLVLGGPTPIRPVCYTDSSLGTGPKRRSISGCLVKLHPASGAIFATAKATVGNRLSTFESELDAAATGFKELAYLRNFLEALHYDAFDASTPFDLFADNRAMIDFVVGDATATNSRYMDIRLFYIRENYLKQRSRLQYMAGTAIPANLLTKLGNADDHMAFMQAALGLSLLDTLDTTASSPAINDSHGDRMQEDNATERVSLLSDGDSSHLQTI